jgi:hypothetical protein
MNLKSLFETLAQVSFAVTGLLLVVVAADRDSHARWFGTKPRRVFTQGLLYFTLLPGFISVCSLIPPSDPDAPVWLWVAGVWGLLSFVPAVLLWVRRRNPDYTALEISYFNLSASIFLAAVSLSVISALGLIDYYGTSGEGGYETAYSIVLAAIVIFAAFNTTTLLNPNLDPEDSETADKYKTENTKSSPELPSEVSIDSHDVYQEQASPISDSTLALSILAFALSLSNIVFALLFFRQERD